MSEIKQELKVLKANDFRPDNWAKIIHETTGYSESYAKKVLLGDRFNKEVGLAIISLFYSEKKKLQEDVERAKS